MPDLSHPDRYLARVVSKRPYRWTLYAILFLTATASLYLRVGMGLAVQALPWYAALLSIYGVVMGLASRDIRCRIAYFSFGMLVASVFTRDLLAGWPRAMGVLEVACSVTTLAALAALARDRAFLEKAAMLDSNPPRLPES